MFFPRLQMTEAARRLAEYSSLSPVQLVSRAETSCDRQYWYPTAPVAERVPKEVLEQFQEEVRRIASGFGYPTTAAGRAVDVNAFDRDLCGSILDLLPMIPSEAATEGVWSFLSLVVLPDIAFWRFPNRGQREDYDRILGKPRHVFRRLWWRAYILGGGAAGLAARLGEDEAVQIQERTRLGGNRHLARMIAEVHLDQEVESGPRMHIMRDAMKRLKRLHAFVAFHSLDEAEVRSVVEEVFETSRAYVTGQAHPEVSIARHIQIPRVSVADGATDDRDSVPSDASDGQRRTSESPLEAGVPAAPSADRGVPTLPAWLRHAACGPLPAGTIPEAADYELAEIPHGCLGTEFGDLPADVLAPWVIRVVDVESPVHLEEVAHRVTRACGVQQVGRLIAASFRRAALFAVSDGELASSGDFLWSERKPDAVVRDRRLLSSQSRQVRYVADEELEWAVALALWEEGSASEMSVHSPVMRRLGFDRTSADTRQRIRAAVQRGIDAGAIVLSQGELTLVGTDGRARGRCQVGPFHPGIAVPYVTATPTLLLRGREFHELPEDEVTAALLDVVDVEGPVHLREAARRLANSVGLERVGSRIMETVELAAEDLCGEGSVELEDSFLAIPGVDVVVRDRSDAPDSVRNIETVSPQEILAAAALLDGTASDDEDELVTEISRVLGFRRTGKDVKAHISNVLRRR